MMNVVINGTVIECSSVDEVKAALALKEQMKNQALVPAPINVGELDTMGAISRSLCDLWEWTCEAANTVYDTSCKDIVDGISDMVSSDETDTNK